MAARADLIVINLIHTVGHVYVALQLVTKLELLSTLRVQIRSKHVQRVWFFLLGGGSILLNPTSSSSLSITQSHIDISYQI